MDKTSDPSVQGRYAGKPAPRLFPPTLQQMKQPIFLCFSLALAGSSWANCGVTERSILGDWEAESRAAPFELMAFERDGERGIFNSWVHERPDYMRASWTLKDCLIRVKHSDDRRLDMNFSIVKASVNKLTLREVNGKQVFAYKRVGK